MKRTDGYVVDAAYPPHFYKEMQPVWLSNLVSFLGSEAPDMTQPYSYCELGCGMGLNLLVAAALNPQGQFVGVDFNEQHLATAREAVDSIGLKNLRFVQADFASFAQDNESSFDFIVSYGTWSWIAPQYQQSILQIVKTFLKPRGVFYLHYMCHPGATFQAPLQKFLNELAQHLSSNSEDSMKAGVALLHELLEARVFDHQPEIKQHLLEMKKRSPAYWAHEYLTDYWQPQHSVDVHRQVAQMTGVLYIGSANTFENVDPILSIPARVRPTLAKMPSPVLQELVKDMARNSNIRTDLFQRDPVASSPEQHIQRVGRIVFKLLPGAPAAVSGALAFATPIGEISGSAEVFSPLLQRLAQGAASFDELARIPIFATDKGLLFQSLQMLMWRGYVHPLRQDARPEPEQVGRLQAWLEKKHLPLNIIEDCGAAFHQT